MRPRNRRRIDESSSRDLPWSTIVVDRDERKKAFRYLDAVLVVVFSDHPGLHADGNGGAAYSLDVSVAAQDIPYENWLMERHGIDGYGCRASLTALFARDAAGDVHLCQEPAPEDISGRVGVGRHGQRAQDEITEWGLGLIGHSCFPVAAWLRPVVEFVQIRCFRLTRWSISSAGIAIAESFRCSGSGP